MCGIVGFFDARITEPESRDLMGKMLETLHHRGPDGNYMYVDCPVALGHTRLKIIDMSDDAQQPMEKDDWVITFNGELYNYIELRQQLEQKSYTFKTQSDTEVVLTSFIEWGANCVEHFIGMWAFVVYDKKKKELFCSRDRFGIKPFYYLQQADCFYFASEYKPMKVSSLFRGKLNIDQVNRGLALGWACHHDQSYFEDIKVLPPAHNLTFKQEGLSIWQYWDLDPTKKSNLSFNDKKERFASMFADSLHIHLRSDAVIGGCLSGGLDSSSIASLIARNYSDRDYKIFNIYYQNSDGLCYDERPFVNEVIKKYPNIQPHFFTPSDKEIVDAFDKSMYHYDVPVNGSSYISQHFLMKMAHDNGVRVLIDGQGADEYLAGYMHTMYPMMAGYLKNFKWLNALKLFINHSTTQKLGAKEMSMLMAKTLMTLLKSDEYIYQFELAKIKPYLLPGHTFDGNLAFRDYSRNTADNFLYNLTMFTSLPTLLHYCDRNSMSFGVEGRVPFLDHRLVEFVFSLNEQDRISNKAETKYIMRQSLADVLPEAIAQRKDKKGFVTPGENLWLRGPLKYLLDIDYKQMDWLDKEKLSVMVEDYKKGSNANAKYVWRLAALNRWLAVGIR